MTQIKAQISRINFITKKTTDSQRETYVYEDSRLSINSLVVFVKKTL